MKGNSNNLKSLAQQGATYHANGQYSEAVRCFTGAIEINPSYAWAYAHRGAARAAIDDWPEGSLSSWEDDFSKAVELNPSYGWAYAHWADAYRSHAIYRLYMKDWAKQHAFIDRSIEHFNKAAELSPGSAWTFAHRGAAYTYKYWLEVMPRLSPLLDLTNSVEVPLSDTDHVARALFNFETACKLNPRYAWAYAFQACVQALKARVEMEEPGGVDFTAARGSLLSALMFDVNHRLRIDRPLAELLNCEGHHRESVAMGTCGLLKDPGDPFLRYFVAVGLKNLGDPAAAAVIAQTQNILRNARSEIDTMLMGLELLNDTSKASPTLTGLKDRRLSFEAIALVAFDRTWSKVRKGAS
jgi:tetratricopeptide (TPR) repeat protein